ncbi:hypothetical protein [Modestobacter sp. NPDC049651]|uniref:hypothetical protein n=1 Tax=unclassified Modestobacter TaxID=2643866 RepID=UPI0033CC96DD
MTSTTTGLPDRYRPLDPIAPEERTPTGVIRSWRARDRVLNRDVALRVHTPGGPAAREWITRALTAGGLASPALAMVYDAAEGTGGTEPGGAAYVVNEWIEGPRLSERLAEGPLPEREARALVRRLAEGVAEAHRVGLAVGGLEPENVVLRAGGLVGLLSVPAATGTVHGDIAALGSLLEACLTGRRRDAAPRAVDAPDLAALVRRARSEDPATGLASVDTLVALLAERPRTGPQDLVRPDGVSDTGWLRRLRDRRDLEDAAAAARGDTGSVPLAARPPLPPVPRTVRVEPRRHDRWEDDGDDLDWDATFGDHDRVAADPGDRDEVTRTARRRLLVLGLPLLALALVVGVGLWMGTSVLSVASSSVDQDTPTRSAPAASSPAPSESGGQPAGSSPAPSSPVAGAPAEVDGVSVFDPFGDGESENAAKARLAVDGDAGTAWTTLTYRGSPAFGNLKPGVGLLVDLGRSQSLAGVRLQSPTSGATVEVRTGQDDAGDLDAFPVAGTTTLGGDDEVAFGTAVDARYVLVWVTGLVPSDGGFAASIGEVTVTTAG